MSLCNVRYSTEVRPLFPTLLLAEEAKGSSLRGHLRGLRRPRRPSQCENCRDSVTNAVWGEWGNALFAPAARISNKFRAEVETAMSDRSYTSCYVQGPRFAAPAGQGNSVGQLPRPIVRPVRQQSEGECEYAYSDAAARKSLAALESSVAG